MHTYINIQIYVYIYVHAHTHTQFVYMIWMDIYVCTYTHTHTHKYWSIVYICIHTRIWCVYIYRKPTNIGMQLMQYIHMNTYVSTWGNISIWIYINTVVWKSYMHICICIYIHMYIHVNTFLFAHISCVPPGSQQSVSVCDGMWCVYILYVLHH